MGDAARTIKVHLIHAFDDTPVENITTKDIDKLRERLLAGKLSHRAVQKVMLANGDPRQALDEAAAEVDRATAEFKKS